MGSAGEAGRDVVSALGDQFGEPLAGQLGDLVIEQAEDDRQRINRLSVTVDRTVTAHVVMVERYTSALGQLREMRGIISVSQQVGDLGEDPRVAVKASGRHDAVVCLG